MYIYMYQWTMVFFIDVIAEGRYTMDNFHVIYITSKCMLFIRIINGLAYSLHNHIWISRPLF